MTYRYVTLLVAVCLWLGASACATIVHGTTQTIPVASTPAGAVVMLDGNRVGNTPCSVEPKRKNEHVITLSLTGYNDEIIKVMPVISGAVAGNIIAGGFIGWGVDAISGAQYRLVPENVTVNMQAKTAGQAAVAPTADTLESRLQELSRLKAEGLISDDEYKTTRAAIMARFNAAPTQTGGTPEVTTATDTGH
mgnify:CR=1 FL=1